MKTVYLAAVAAIAVTGAGLAQDPGAAPAFGSVSLDVGFTPDPYTVDITSGGTINARNLGGNCRGWVARAPDFDLYYGAGSLPLTIAADSNSDTTLVINGPDGRWYCDDDGGDGLNPEITFGSPQSGLYDIWIGSYSEGDYADATLSISELGQTASSSSGGGYSGVDMSLSATYGSHRLSAGFSPDPYVVNMTSGGGNRASDVASGCNGWVASAPDYELSYSAGSLPLILSVASNSDTTLMVNGPDGRWYCNDDGGSGTNPSLRFDNPQSGVYDIWVGSYSQGGGANANLHISELYSQ